MSEKKGVSEFYMVPADEYQHLLKVEKEWLELQSQQAGHGDDVHAEYLEYKNKSELKTPVAQTVATSDGPYVPPAEPASKNRYIKFVDQLKEVYRPKARELLHALSEHSDVLNWNELGDITINGVSIVGANLKDLLPLVFYGSRQKFTSGQDEFFGALNQLNLSRFVRNKSKLRQAPLVAETKSEPTKKWYRLHKNV
jgi:hypothetical protein